MSAASAYPWYQHVVAWFALISIVTLIALAIVRAVSGVSVALRRGPNVDADVRVLFAENLNVNQDPTRPEEHYAAANEFRQHMRGG